MISNVTKYPTTFSVQNTELLSNAIYKFDHTKNDYLYDYLYCNQYDINLNLIKSDSSSKDFKKIHIDTKNLSELSFDEIKAISEQKFLIEVEFVHKIMKNNIIPMPHYYRTDKNQILLFDQFNIDVNITSQYCGVNPMFNIDVKIEPIKINIDKEQQKQAAADRATSFRALFNKPSQKSNQSYGI